MLLCVQFKDQETAKFTAHIRRWSMIWRALNYSVQRIVSTDVRPILKALVRFRAMSTSCDEEISVPSLTRNDHTPQVVLTREGKSTLCRHSLHTSSHNKSAWYWHRQGLVHCMTRVDQPTRIRKRFEGHTCAIDTLFSDKLSLSCLFNFFFFSCFLVSLSSLLLSNHSLLTFPVFFFLPLFLSQNVFYVVLFIFLKSQIIFEIFFSLFFYFSLIYSS